MDKTTDSSVLMNLKDLFVMEADRRVDEAAAIERTKAEEAARAERERREHEEAIRDAREQERRLAQAELAAQHAAVEARISRLRAELDLVRQDRERTRLEVAATARPEPPSRRGNWIVGTMAAMSLVAALTATFVAWPQPALQPVQPESPTVAVVDGLDEPQLPIAEPTVVEPTEPTVVEVIEAVATTPAQARPRPRPRPRPHVPANDLGSQLDFGNDDGLIPSEAHRRIQR